MLKGREIGATIGRAVEEDRLKQEILRKLRLRPVVTELQALSGSLQQMLDLAPAGYDEDGDEIRVSRRALQQLAIRLRRAAGEVK